VDGAKAATLMAFRKVLLSHRIMAQAGNEQAAMGDAHPDPGSAVPMVMPVALVTVYPVDSNYVTLAMQDMAPLLTAEGSLVPATGPGRWDQVALAGGGRHG
jgi:hypothetical protein